MHTTTITTSPAIALRGLTKRFSGRGGGQAVAVAGIDLTIDRGEVVALLGPNGAGKTTTLDMVVGLIPPSSGSVETLGLAPRAAVAAGRVSAVLQTGGLLGDLTVRETVRMIASLIPNAAPVDEVIARAGITEIAGRRVAKCSGGEKQRLRFALALLADPDLLILDEPTTGMDVTARQQFWETMRAEADAGRTVVFATHYLQEADAFAERIVVMAGGRIIADGNVADIRGLAATKTVSAELGDPGAGDLLRAMPGVTRVSMLGRRVEIAVEAAHSDRVARALLTDLSATNLEIATASLEAAFVELTNDHADPREVAP